jgi:hypothetical protein
MNRAAQRAQKRQERASAALGILGAVLCAVVAGAVVVALLHWIATVPSGWWLPVAQRPFGGAL